MKREDVIWELLQSLGNLILPISLSPIFTRIQKEDKRITKHLAMAGKLATRVKLGTMRKKDAIKQWGEAFMYYKKYAENTGEYIEVVYCMLGFLYFLHLLREHQ